MEEFYIVTYAAQWPKGFITEGFYNILFTHPGQAEEFIAKHAVPSWVNGDQAFGTNVDVKYETVKLARVPF